MRNLLLFLLACAAAACGADTTARSTLTAAVDTVNGVERLSYPADAASPLAWRFDTLAVIGGAMVDDENYQFETRGLAGSAQGHLFVLDGQGKRILRYDENGSFVAELRPGGWRARRAALPHLDRARPRRLALGAGHDEPPHHHFRRGGCGQPEHRRDDVAGHEHVNGPPRRRALLPDRPHVHVLGRARGP